MKKQYALIPIGLIISLITSLVLAFGVHDNFSKYGGYYATQLPRGEGKHPELILIMKYLEHIPYPDNSQLYYDYDGINSILKNASHSIVGNGQFIEIRYPYEREPEDNRQHVFSASGQYFETSYYYHNSSDNKVRKRATPEDETEAYDLAYEIIQRLIDVQKAPPKGQNLQWLFNLIYQKQFE